MTIPPEKLSSIGLDVDEVVAQLHTPWVRWIRGRWPDSPIMEPPGFLTWNHPEEVHGKEVFDFLHPVVYDSDLVQPYPGTLDAVRVLRKMGFHIAWVTSCMGGTMEAKRRWMIRHGFLQTQDSWLPDVKKQTVKVDALVDDAPHNLKGFPGRQYLVTRSHNRNASDFAAPWIRVDGLTEVLAYLV